MFNFLTNCNFLKWLNFYIATSLLPVASPIYILSSACYCFFLIIDSLMDVNW